VYSVYSQVFFVEGPVLQVSPEIYTHIMDKDWHSLFLPGLHSPLETKELYK
jgi:hypothetical protein